MAAVRSKHNADLAARVVAWHNRHPLATRITPASIVSIGVVAVPFWAPAGDRPPPPTAPASDAAATPDATSGSDATPAAEAAPASDAAPQAFPTVPPEHPASEASPPAAAEDADEFVVDSPDAEGPSAEPLAGDASASDTHGPDPTALHAQTPDPHTQDPHTADSQTPDPAPTARPVAEGHTAAAGPDAEAADVPVLHETAPPRGTRAPAATTTARQRAKTWKPAFVQDLLRPHTPAQVARWMLRHGSDDRPGNADAPRREFETRGTAPAGMVLAQRWAYAVAIEVGAQRMRVLVSPQDTRRALGPRVMGRARMGAAAAGAMTLVLAGALGVAPGLHARRSLPPDAAHAAQAAPDAHAAHAAQAAAAPARSASGAADMPASAHAAHSVDGPASSPGHTTLHADAASSPAASASAPPTPDASSAEVRHAHPAQATAHPAAPGAAHLADVAPSPAAATTTPASAAHVSDAGPSAPRADRADAEGSSSPASRGIVPVIDEEARRAGRAASEAARAERAQRLDGRRGPSAAVSPPATPPSATAWAVSAERTRSRADSERQLGALREAARRSGHGPDLRIEVMASGEDWRAVGWPLTQRADAERLRDALTARGHKAEIVPF